MITISSIIAALGSSKIGAKTAVVIPTITTSAGAYASGDCVGGLLTLEGAVSGKNNTATLKSIHVKDSAAQAANLTILLFSAEPTGLTTTDNSAFAYGSGNGFTNEVAKINVAAADYQTIDSKSVACIDTLAKVVQGLSGQNIYAAIITTSTPTYGAGGDKLQIIFNFWQD